MDFELNKVEVKLTVGGKDCFIVYLRLTQGFNSHHKFECVVDYNDLESRWMAEPDSIFGLLGEDAVIGMKHRNGTGEYRFRGIVAHVAYIGRHGSQNHIRISGYSPTKLLDGSKTMDSFMDMKLKNIVSEAVENSGNGAKVTAQPKFTEKIEYIAQYGETCFEFLNRLSYIYGEWFFYDGEQCFFGKWDGETETITFESEMTTMDFCANLMPTKMKQYHYLVHDDDKIDKEAATPSTDNYHTAAQVKSQSVFTSEATLPSGAVVQSGVELEQLTKVDKDSTTAAMLIMSGTAQTSKVKIGGQIKVELPQNAGVEKSVGTFIVTSVTHEYDLKGSYRNSFTAIPATTDNIPMPPFDFPKAFPQIATVKSNDDEQKRGRVKVEFQWQEAKGKTTNWIRVQTDSAGKSGKVPKNRGIVFIPEKDDIVMINFEYGDPSRPYVSGSIFSEKVSVGGRENNRIKSITTRSGITVVFDDDENKGSLTVKDPSGNITKHDGNGNISINAPNTLSITCTNFRLNASNSINIQSTGADGKAGTIDIIARKTMALKTENDSFSVESLSSTISMKAKMDFSASSETESMKLQASKDATLESSDIKINASSTIRVKSNDTDVI